MLIHTARIVLILDALVFLMVGTFLFTDPGSLAYLNIDSAAGNTAIRTWGAMFIGIGIVGLVSSLNKKWVEQGLLALLIIGGLIVLARIYGIAVDGLEPKQTSELRDESLGPILALVGLILCWRHKRRDNASRKQSGRKSEIK